MPRPGEEIEPVFGLSGDDAALVDDTLLVNPEEFSFGPLADCKVTIIGFDVSKGGEIKERNDGTGTYVTQDQLVMHLRIDNPEDLDYDGKPFTRQFFNLPQVVIRDGAARRAKPTRTSTWATWLNALANLGVAAEQGLANLYQFKQPSDLIGLSFHRERVEVKGYNNNSIPMDLPTEIYGIDNDVRKRAGLNPISLK